MMLYRAEPQSIRQVLPRLDASLPPSTRSPPPPPGKLEAAYHKADKAIEAIVDLLAAA